MRNSSTLARVVGSGLVLLGLMSHAHAAPAGVSEDPNHCGPLSNGYGPYDYRNQQDKLSIVETHHFTPQVEDLSAGQEGFVGGDLDYTLRAFPNHHRALIATSRLADQLKEQPARGMPRTYECYFDRAIRFAPDDALVRIIYAHYLNKRSRHTEAVAQLDAAGQYATDNPFTHYNIGLSFFEMREYDKASEQAQIAKSLGFERTDLIDKLKNAGKWVEPASPAASAAPAGSAALSPEAKASQPSSAPSSQ